LDLLCRPRLRNYYARAGDPEFTTMATKKMTNLCQAPLRHFLLACFALGCATFAQADIIVAATFNASNQAAPPDTTDYEGQFYDFASTFPANPITIGMFAFTIPKGDVVTSATISGTFGDQNIPVTALIDLFVLNGTIEVGACDSNSSPCAAGTINGLLVPWSFTFNAAELKNLASDFAGGSLDFTAVQNSFGAAIVGTPSLDIQVATPEPSTVLTMAGGLLALAVWRRRK
jgi:PEP-CTERM motif